MGMGTIMSAMLPYSLVFAIAWIALPLVFILFNLPLGIDGSIYM